MKIAFCLGSLNKGGAERVVSNLSNYLINNGNEVIIIVTKLSEIEYKLDNRIKVYSLDDDNSENKGLLLRNIRRLKKLKSILLNNNLNIVLAFLQEPIARLLILRSFFRSVRKIPSIISVRIDPLHAFDSLKTKLTLPLYNSSNGFVFQTEEIKEFFNKKIQKRSVVIPNSLNYDFYNNKIFSKERDKRIVSVGRLTAQKNFPMLINGFNAILKDFPDYTLEIYGDGELKNDLLLLIKNLKLDNKVFLMGNVSNLKEKIERSSLFIMTSDYEGLSNALMESLALGIPTICTDSDGGGARELIKNNYNGVLIDKNDVKTLSRKIKYVLLNKDYAKILSENAVKSMKKYNPDLINKRWEDYIIKITNQTK